MHSLHIDRVLVLAALILSVVLLCSAPSYADTSGNVTLAVGQSFNKTGEIPDDFDGSRQYEFSANDSGDPMPNGQTGGTYVFTLTDDQELVFTTSGDGGKVSEPALYFTHAGVFEYTVKPLTAEPDENYTFENTVYTVRIYVENNPLKAGDLIVRKIVCENNQGEKPDYIRYHCSYTGPAPEPDEPDKPDKPVVTPGINTGDYSNLTLWVSVLALAVSMFFFMIFRGRKENRR